MTIGNVHSSAKFLFCSGSHHGHQHLLHFHSISVVANFLSFILQSTQRSCGFSNQIWVDMSISVFAILFTNTDNLKNIEKRTFIKDNSSDQHNMIIYFLFNWLKTSRHSHSLIFLHWYLAIIWLLEPDFFPFGLRMVLLLIYLKLEGERSFFCSVPPTTLFPVYFLLARFRVRKISSVAAVACSSSLFFAERGSTIIT